MVYFKIVCLASNCFCNITINLKFRGIREGEIETKVVLGVCCLYIEEDNIFDLL